MTVHAPELVGSGWVQGGPLALHALRGKVVLLDFFTFGCINCMNNLPMLARLQERYSETLQVIGVHSSKFAYEKEAAAVRSAAARLRIAYPILNDSDGYLVGQYAVKAWPTVVLIDARGYIAAQFRGEAQGAAIDLTLQNMGLFPKSADAERFAAKRALCFPEAVACGEGHLYVANSGGGDVREYTETGRPLRRFAPFGFPSALAVDNGALYIADREGGRICRIDLKTEERTVLLERLRSPSALLVDAGTITVAEAGAHRIAIYDKKSLQVQRLFGNRFEALRDGDGEAAQLAQPMGMARCDDATIWFVDAESSALRFIEGEHVRTVVGEGLFTFGDSDADPILLQHPQGIACGRIGDGCGGGRLFIADTYNGKIKAFDPIGKRMMSLLEGLAEPTGIAKKGCSLFIAETGAHRIVRLDLSTMRTETVCV